VNNIYVGITDFDWFKKLSAIPKIDEVNFWQPGGKQLFKVLAPGEMFLFKLRAPRNCIVGGGFFIRSSLLPLSLAWESFGEKNGVESLEEMRLRTTKLRHDKSVEGIDYTVGCVILGEPFFFSEPEWIPVSSFWSPAIVQGKHFSLNEEIGSRLFREVHDRLQLQRFDIEHPILTASEPRFGSPQTILPRLGQGAFRVVVTEEYGRCCSITKERTLPVLEAAHIKPYTQSGPHEIGNGILLRSDLHILLDKGYITINDRYRLEVSKRIKEEFENGRDYYKLMDSEIHKPLDLRSWPDKKYLQWHNENVFRK